jgi:chemotaxis protein MotB
MPFIRRRQIGYLLALVLVIPLLPLGCVSAQQRETAFRLEKAETERDTTEVALRDERARAAALADHLASAERRATAAQAETAALREQSQALQKQRDEAVALIEQRANAPLARPAAPASILPADFDDALRAFAVKFQHRVWYDRSRGALSFANDQLFDSGSDVVLADAQASLHELAAVVNRALPSDFELIVVGHTDDTPITKPETLTQHASNWHLSVHRAIAVKDVLVKAGVPDERFGVMGYGAERPIGSDRARNRRVEIFFVRKGDVRSFAPVKPGFRAIWRDRWLLYVGHGGPTLPV